MTAFVPNRLVDMLRGTAADAYGDEVDTLAVAEAAVPVLVTEAGRSGTGSARAEQGPASATPRTVRRLRGRCRPGVEVRNGDRWRDCSSGEIFRVVGVNDLSHVAGLADTTCALVRVTAAG